MRDIPYNLEGWPRRKNGEPIFTSTEMAIFYAHLIGDSLKAQSEILAARKKAVLECEAMRVKTNPNLNRAFEIAVKAQFCRECLEEVERIKEGKG